ncbi:hypothetical protein B0T26DRAFT_757712 [Lasiosphaeria miniovina]|uniref:Uncharacterized protein n=1 Tax=Lasiosphaeria miniovina TaxID=1954250 RepID=A0AA40DFP3_9PEZI|nr:uncharacterized protein B0T26DRAFT_757712 [Lasiosphaeria miniovina]KAK0701719.1 hypothetical protein B0T26DRAFT_757712 [Lasiosphaeria miniovina]
MAPKDPLTLTLSDIRLTWKGSKPARPDAGGNMVADMERIAKAEALRVGYDEDLHDENLRKFLWDQVHPKPKLQFRQNRYENCVPWETTTETFLQQTEPHEHSYPDWVGGTYIAIVSVLQQWQHQQTSQQSRDNEILILLTLYLDFTKGVQQMSYRQNLFIFFIFVILFIFNLFGLRLCFSLNLGLCGKLTAL